MMLKTPFGKSCKVPSCFAFLAKQSRQEENHSRKRHVNNLLIKLDSSSFDVAAFGARECVEYRGIITRKMKQKL